MSIVEDVRTAVSEEVRKIDTRIERVNVARISGTNFPHHRINFTSKGSEFTYRIVGNTTDGFIVASKEFKAYVSNASSEAMDKAVCKALGKLKTVKHEAVVTTGENPFNVLTQLLPGAIDMLSKCSVASRPTVDNNNPIASVMKIVTALDNATNANKNVDNARNADMSLSEVIDMFNRVLNNIALRPTVDNVASRQTVDNVASRQTVDNVASRQTVDNVASRPTVDNVASRPTVDSVMKIVTTALDNASDMLETCGTNKKTSAVDMKMIEDVGKMIANVFGARDSDAKVSKEKEESSADANKTTASSSSVATDVSKTASYFGTLVDLSKTTSSSSAVDANKTTSSSSAVDANKTTASSDVENEDMVVLSRRSSVDN
jgi:hypothetical protein